MGRPLVRVGSRLIVPRYSFPPSLAAYAKELDDGSIRLRLEWPIENGSETVSAITLKRPKAKHLRGISGGELTTGQAIDLAGKLAALESHILDDIDGSDVMRIAETLGVFFPDSPAAGGKT